MKTILILVGKTVSPHLKALMDDYVSRITHYVPFEVKIVPEPKNAYSMTKEKQCCIEGEAIIKILQAGDWIIPLDEHGREYRSIEFANRLKYLWQTCPKRIVFIIGGPYGLSQEVKAAAAEQMSLSRMTFSHQMVRVIFAEQFYRALTIIKGEPYHHE